ncbi:phospholipase D family protein [Mesorhizobium sp. Mes31]|uniref:phospholipase D family protein n=1 Tax=Mesorhizobium sp. Mes31 TaxID=2926017 RepID=UPI0021188F9F|nr:phospholipase D family protein [Mesorhizobium sp. Mes31]
MNPTLQTEVLFDRPQQEIASLIGDRINRCDEVSIVVGFATEGGLNAIASPLAATPGKLKTFVLGAATHRGYDALDQLQSYGIPADRLLVHLGHTTSQATGGFVKYHPMMHSKVYLMEMSEGRTCAFIGSHNLTSFALNGKNGEAGVLIEGEANNIEFQKIRSHIAEACSQSVQYDPSMKDALSWWAAQYFDGIRQVIVVDDDSDIEARKTFVIFAETSSSRRPKKNERIYFEIPSGLGLNALASEVHIYIFDKLPGSPMEALDRLDGASYSLWCKTQGLELKRGGVELQAEWQIVGSRAPTLRLTPTPFRPSPTADMQQVRVNVFREVKGRFKYLFGQRDRWQPVYDTSERLDANIEVKLDAAASEEPQRRWDLVRGLEKVGPIGRRQYLEAIKEVSPEAGNFLLLSSRRIDLEKRKSDDDKSDEATDLDL